jgi:hypothetical protein
VSFELLPVMGGPEPRAALQHQRRSRVSARGAPRAGSVQLPGTHRPRASAARQVARAVRSGAEQARPSGERQRAARLDALSTQALSAGRKPARRHRGDRTGTGPVRAGDVSEGAFRDPSLTRGVTLAQKRMICACP